MSAGTSCSKHRAGHPAVFKGVRAPEESSRQFGVPSTRGFFSAGSRCFVRGFWRFFVSERYPSLRRRFASTFLSLRRDDSGPLRIHRQSSPLGFGKLLGIYVVMFFIVAQILAKVRFNQAPTAPIYLGGALIVAGGFVIGFWRS
jgi:hypothetical protein